MEYKYLSDGRKVVVIGQLNNIESIVQEVFVTKAGDQIPSGEKFTTKNLHDEPVKSWKQKKEKEWEDKADAAEKRYRGIERDISEIVIKQKGMKEIFRQSNLLASNLDEQTFNTLITVMGGSCKYLVLDNYGSPKIVEFNESLTRIDAWNGHRKFDGIKLMSLYGRADGNIEYRLNDYNDGSGSWKGIFPFENKELAVQKVKEIILGRIELDRLPDLETYKNVCSMGIVFTKKIDTKIKNRLLSNKKKWLKQLSEKHDKETKKTNDEILAVNDIFSN